MVEKVSHQNKIFARKEGESKKEAGVLQEDENETDPNRRDREFFRHVPKSLIRRLYRIHQVDFEMFGYKLDKDVFYNVGINA